MKMKLLLVATVIYVFAQQASAELIESLYEDIESGLVLCKNTSAPGKLEVQERVEQPGKFLSVVESTIMIPGEGFFPDPISCILVEDQKTDGSGGAVSILDGGIDQFRVTLKMISKRGKGLDYKISVYL